MASKRLVDVDQTTSFGSFFVNDRETVKQIPKEEVLNQFYTKEQVDEMIPEIPEIPEIPDIPDVSDFVTREEILPSASVPSGMVCVSNGSGSVAWIDPTTLFANADSEVL